MRHLPSARTYTHTHTHPFNGPFPGRPGWADTRKVKPLWILQKQETVSGRGISWAICKSEPRSRQITMPAPHHSVFYRLDALPATNQQRQSTEGKYIWPVTPCSNKIFQFIIGGAANTSCPVYQSQKSSIEVVVIIVAGSPGQRAVKEVCV